MASRSALGFDVSTRVLVRSGTALEAVYSNWRVSIEAVSSAHNSRCRSSCERYTQEKPNTSAVMSVVIANTIVALRLIKTSSLMPVLGSQSGVNPWAPAENRERRTVLLLLRCHYCIRRPSVLLELVMQRLQADAENLRSPGLIVSRRL